MKNTNLDIRFNKANNIISQFSDSWDDDKLILLPNFPKLRIWYQTTLLKRITYDLPYDLFYKIDNMGLVPYGHVTHEELTQTYYNQRF